MDKKGKSMKDTDKELRAKVAMLEKEVARLKNAVKGKKFGLVWMDVPEKFKEESENAMPVLKEVAEMRDMIREGYLFYSFRPSSGGGTIPRNSRYILSRYCLPMSLTASMKVL